ncbi:amidohydrolase family protein [Natrinema versiforme]|uniref:Amidohydrolase n=1 Tax=Natrinema versiforme TaxID=88724 RepID=A0A4P8WQW1_9EURY|nr:amidohydrolase family protein [Natrinema versiforme]QCS44541.1 amidohydrolase [Natrinema versiforme]
MSGTDSEPFDAIHQVDRPIIDAHVHLLPDRVLKAIRKWFHQEVSWTLPTVTKADVFEYLTTLDGAVCFPYAHKPGVARSMNRTVADVVVGIDHVVGLATVHARDDNPVDIVQEGLDAGLAGVKLHCPVQEFPPSDSRLDPVYELAVEHDLPVIVHASSHPFYRDSDLVGPEATKRVLERFPGLRLCIPHLGLFETDAFLDLADRYDRVAFDTAVAVGEQVHELIGTRDEEYPIERIRRYTDRVMFGTDYPTYPDSVVYGDLIDATAAAFPQARDRVFYRNAIDFYGVDADFGE